MLHLVAFDIEGNEIWQYCASNLIVASGYTIAAEALAGVIGATLTHVAVGTNGNEPQDDDTEITGATTVAITGVEYPERATVRFNFHIDYTDAVGMSIREFGLLSADGRLFSRKVREAIEKTEHMAIAGMWKINI